MIRDLIKGCQDRLRTRTGCVAAEIRAVVLVYDLLAAGFIVAVKTEIIRLQIRIQGTARIENIGKQGMRSRTARR